MAENVGLSTPRGSGTSGYVQRNFALMKPRNRGYGAPYPPVSGANNAVEKPFKQRMPDKQILEHDRRRAIEVKVMEERERLEEENERIEEKQAKLKSTSKGKGKGAEEEGEDDADEGEKVLSDEEIDERCEALRQRLIKELADEEAGGARRDKRSLLPKDRRQLKSYQVHELAEAKIEESERLRKALGIREDRETGELSGGRRPYEDRGRRRD